MVVTGDHRHNTQLGLWIFRSLRMMRNHKLHRDHIRQTGWVGVEKHPHERAFGGHVTYFWTSALHSPSPSVATGVLRPCSLLPHYFGHLFIVHASPPPRGEDLLCCLNYIQSVGLWKCLYDHQLANKACFSNITVKNIYRSFTHKMAAKASWHWNYVAVMLCIDIDIIKVITRYTR